MRLHVPRPRGTGRGARLLVMIVAAVLVLDVAAAGASWLTRPPAGPALPHFVLGAAPVQVAGHPSDLLPPEPLNGDERTAWRTGTSGSRPPEELAKSALAALARYDESSSAADLSSAARALEGLLPLPDDGILRHDYVTLSLPGPATPAPWFSAEAQGLALSAAARLAAATGDGRWRDAAHELFDGLLSFRGFARFGSPPPTKPWTSFVDDQDFLWFEAFAGDVNPSASLTAHATTLFGIYEYWALTGKELAERLFRGGAATFEQYLEAPRVRGGLAHNGLPAGPRDQARHVLLMRQIPLVAEMTATPSLTAALQDYAQDLEDSKEVQFVLADLESPRPGVTPYAPLPGRYRYSTELDPPATVSAQGEVLYDGEVYPELSAAYALAALDRYEAGDGRVWLARARTAVARATAYSPDATYPHDFPSDSYFGELAPGWHSALAPGLLMSAAARLFDVTGEQRWRRVADQALSGLRLRSDPERGDLPWTAFVDDSGHLWFEQYPDDVSPTVVLSGHLSVTIGLYDHWRLTGSRAAERLFLGGVATVEEYAGQLRVPGGPSRVSIVLDQQAEVSVHRQVVQQLTTLSRMTGSPAVARLSEEFAADE